MKIRGENISWQPPWTGGSRLVTLWDMKEYLAPRLTDLARDFFKIQVHFIGRGGEYDDEEDRQELAEARKGLPRWCQKIADEAEFLGLQSTKRQAGRIAKIAGQVTPKEIDVAVVELETRFDEETQELKLFYVPADQIDFYNKTDLFGEEFKEKFPQANSEICEAGKCFAFDRYTACVFHLTRSLEIALRVLFVSLGMLPRIWSVTKWQKILERIAGKIKKNNERPATDSDWQEKRAFYEKAHAFLAAAANPLRNSCVHVDVIYTDQGSVRPVWLGTEAFMRHLATKLKETT
jgi:hypothetical protein